MALIHYTIGIIASYANDIDAKDIMSTIIMPCRKMWNKKVKEDSMNTKYVWYVTYGLNMLKEEFIM
jgi:hypothetical protein